MKRPATQDEGIVRDVPRAFRLKAATLHAKHLLERVVKRPPEPRSTTPTKRLRVL